MGKVIAVCISEKKGTQKKEVEEVRLVEDWGIRAGCACRKMASAGEPAFI